MTFPDKEISHFLFSAFPAWGHVRPFCILAARLVKDDENMVVTLILAPTLLSKAQAEITAEFRDVVSDDVRRRVRVLSSFNSDSKDLFTLFAPFFKTYATAYYALSQARPVSCAVTGTVFDAVPPPNVVILDFFAYAQLQSTRAITGRSVPIISWVTGHAASISRVFGPQERGGHGDLGQRIVERARRTGVKPEEIGDSIYNHTDGTVIKIPGVPPMYDWEFFPQELAFKAPISEIMTMGHRSLKECDAVFSASAYAFERESLDKGLRSWLSDWNKDLYVIGPLLPSGYGIVADSPRGSTETREFLDNALAEHGEKSVMLISFGTIFWPTKQEYIEEVIEALIQRKFPFIISYASPFAALSDNLIQRMTSSGLGLVSKWFPQQFILNHPAAGWFITHGGHNSVMETLGSGIPMICWPIEADQPAAAVHLTENLKVAFELIEVRTGDNGMKPLHRNGRQAKGTRQAVGVEIREIIDACRSDKGDELRKNAQKLKATLADAWGADGISRVELHAFLAKYGQPQVLA